MSAVNRSIRTVSRSLRLRSTPPALTLTPARSFGPSLALSSSSSSSSASFPLYHHHHQHSFSTTTARMSAPPVPSQNKAYDPEIEDITKYVTKPIKSELAVSRSLILPPLLPTPPILYTTPRLTVSTIPVRYSTMGVPRYAGLWSGGFALQGVH